MKKSKKYYAINNQEDEDGITLYPGDAIINKNQKNKRNINSQEKTENNESVSNKLKFRNLSRSGLVMENRISERRMD